MKIPKQFELLGHTIKVKLTKDLVYTSDNVGEARMRDSDILLQDNAPGHPRQPFQLEHEFCHELVHHILGRMNEEELNKNEAFVDLFGGLLHQALKSGGY